jgi:hypothetical protein
MRGFILATLATVLILPLSTTHAQIGGRIRSTVTNATRTQQQPAGPAALVPVPINAQVVTNYEKALGARQREIQRLSQENTEVGRYYAAQQRKEAAQQRENEYNAGRGPDAQRYQQLLAAMQQGDTTAVPKMTQLLQSIQDTVTVPELDWSTQQSANAHLDSLMMQASGYSAGEWAYLNDKLPGIVGYVAENNAKDDSVVTRLAQTYSITPAEVRAINARRIELARGYGWPFRTDEQLAEAGRPAKPAPAEDPTKNYNACLTQEMKPIMDEADRRKAELDAAQQAGDMTKLVEFANRVSQAQMAATQKCAPLMNH